MKVALGTVQKENEDDPAHDIVINNDIKSSTST